MMVKIRRIRSYFKNLKFSIVLFIVRTKRALAYAKHGFYSEDYDYIYIIKDLVFKLERMEGYKLKSKDSMDFILDSREDLILRHCTFLLKRGISDYHEKKLEEEFFSKYGQPEYKRTLINDSYTHSYFWKGKMNNKIDEEYRKVYSRAEILEQNDLKAGLVLFTNYIRFWWW